MLKAARYPACTIGSLVAPAPAVKDPELAGHNADHVQEEDDEAESYAWESAVTGASHGQLVPRHVFDLPPNLHKEIFARLNQEAPGEKWLEECVKDFDSGTKRRRKEILQGFLDFVQQSRATGLEALFSHQAERFFVRLTAWFALTLPMLYELPLQLKVFLVFLEFREQTFVKAFFESGAIVPLLHTLSAAFDVPDEVRCLAIAVLHKLAEKGCHYKELLCEHGLIPTLLESAADGLKWETLKCIGRLLCEVFRTNLRYQEDVVDGLQNLMTQSLPLTQRVGIQAVISLLNGLHPPVLKDTSRHAVWVMRAVSLLDSPDTRVVADAYCLICKMVRMFHCDRLLMSFAREQLMHEEERASEMLRVELETHERDIQKGGGEGGGAEVQDGDAGGTDGATAATSPGKSTVLQFTGRLQTTPHYLDIGIIETMDSNAFCEAFRFEAGTVLKWGLLLFLVKRNKSLCEELVKNGLVQTLLTCLVDSSHPLRQSAALMELHHLRIISPEANTIAVNVLQKQELLSAVSLEQFQEAATPRSMQRARYTLRNLQVNSASDRGGATFKTFASAKELDIKQEMLEHEMAVALDLRPNAVKPMSLFLTEASAAESQHESREVTPTQDGTQSADGAPATGRGSRKSIAASKAEDLDPFYGCLSSLIFDPLEINADEDSPLIQEIRKIEKFVGTGALGAAVAAASSSKAFSSAPIAPPKGGRRRAIKPSHRPTIQHSRAMALGGAHKHPQQLSLAQLGMRIAVPRSESQASTQVTEMSLRCGDPAADWGSMQELYAESSIDSVFGSAKQASHFYSLAETTVGMEPSWEISAFPSASLSKGPVCFGAEASADLLMGEADPHFVEPCVEMDPSAIPVYVAGGDSLPPLPLLDGEAILLGKTSSIAITQALPGVRQLEEGFADANLEAEKHPKRFLHVLPPPFDEYVDYDAEEREVERRRVGKVLVRGLNPDTKGRMEKLSLMGGFPRKAVLRATARSQHWQAQQEHASQILHSPRQRLPLSHRSSGHQVTEERRHAQHAHRATSLDSRPCSQGSLGHAGGVIAKLGPSWTPRGKATQRTSYSGSGTSSSR